MAAIVFPGGVLRNVWIDTPADRFNALEPAARVIGQRRTLLSTGAPRVWRYRDDFTCAFEHRDLAYEDVALCLALALHLDGGGEVEVQTDDVEHRTYPRCVLAPGAEAPQPKLDPETMRWSMSYALLNLDGAPLIALYA